MNRDPHQQACEEHAVALYDILYALIDQVTFEDGPVYDRAEQLLADIRERREALKVPTPVRQCRCGTDLRDYAATETECGACAASRRGETDADPTPAPHAL